METCSPISLACRLIAASNVGLLENEENKTLIVMALEKLLNIQNGTDYGYDIDAFYNGHRTLYFGSRALSTALAVSVKVVNQKFSAESLINFSL